MSAILELGLNTGGFTGNLKRAADEQKAFERSWVGVGKTFTSVTREMEREQQALFAALNQLEQAQQRRTLENTAAHRPEIILQREILGLKQSIANIEGTTTEKLRLQISLEEKQLALERMIAQQRTQGSASLAGGIAAAVPAAREADGIFGSMLGKLKNMFGAGALLKGLFAGLGIQTVQAAVDKLVDKYRQAAEDAKTLDQLTGQVADKQIAAMRSTLSDTERYTLLLKDMDRIQREMADNRQRTAQEQQKAQTDHLALLDKEKEASELLAKIEADAAKQFEESDKNRLHLAEQLSQIKKQYADEERKYAQEAYDLQQKADEKHMADVKENYELLVLTAKSARGLTEDEAARLEVLKLIVKQRAMESEITSLLSLKNRTPEEETRLQILIRQGQQLDDQIKQKQALIATTAQQVKVEEAVADSLGFALGKLKSFVAEWTGFQSSITTTGRGDKDLTEAELTRKINQIKRDIFQRSIPGQSFDLGSDLLLQAQKSNLAQAMADLSFRRQVQQTNDLQGRDATLQRYPGLSEQRLDEILRGRATQDEKLNTTLTKLDRNVQSLSEGLKDIRRN